MLSVGIEVLPQLALELISLYTNVIALKKHWIDSVLDNSGECVKGCSSSLLQLDGVSLPRML